MENKSIELWDVYDIHRNKKNKTMIRGSEFAAGDYHMVVHVCIFNEKGEMLIQQRQPFKEGWPNMWDVTVGGSSLAGETSQEAAEREVREEIGLSIDLKGIRPKLTINFEPGFDDWYTIKQEVSLEQLTLQEEEVQDVKWATKDEILKMIENGEFIPYHESMIRLLFDIRNQYGTFQNHS